MICINCKSDNNLKERDSFQGRCKKCQHKFAFDPKRTPDVDFTDTFFQQILEKLSANNSLFFTSRQLYYFFNERRHRKKADRLKGAVGCLMAVAIIFTVFAFATGLPWIVFAMPALVIPFSIAALLSPRLRRRLSGGAKEIPITTTPKQIEYWYWHWCKINGDTQKLLPSATAKPNLRTPAKPISIELQKYSFDRAVICERAEIAQFLIANNFHFENNSAVLSVDGYPQDVFDAVMEMLRRNPELHVYALHDASVRGVALPHTLSTQSFWFAGSSVRIFDLGLLPRQIFNRPVFVEKGPPSVIQIPEPIRSTLQPEEISWLMNGNSVSLESFPPRMLLRIVTQGIAKSRDPRSEDAIVPVVWLDGGPGFYYYGAESFG